MTIPFVIDNQQHNLADALHDLLAHSAGKPLDIATAYFALSGYRLVKEGLHRVATFRPRRRLGWGPGTRRVARRSGCPGGMGVNGQPVSRGVSWTWITELPFRRPERAEKCFATTFLSSSLPLVFRGRLPLRGFLKRLETPQVGQRLQAST